MTITFPHEVLCCYNYMEDMFIAYAAIQKQNMNFINTKKSFTKLYMFYFETFRIILNPSPIKKNRSTGM